MSFAGIDVSRWQGNIDWNAVKKSGVNFAILKAGGSDDGFYTDSKFEENYKNAKVVGMPLGAYYFVGPGCKSKNDGIADAKRFIDILKGKQFEYPVYIDFESPSTSNKAGNTDACIGFCETMEAAGYYCGIYASDISGFVDRLDQTKLSKFDKWVARYGSKPTATPEYGMWQHTSESKIAGINGNVDANIAYKDYPTIIKNGNFNGFKKAEVKTETTIDWKAKYEAANAKLEAIKKILK